jgi:putative hydrolase
MKIFADLHTHTLASGHAFSTLKENALAAKEKGLEILGVSDHGPAMSGAFPENNFSALAFFCPEYLEGVRILKGAELNILGGEPFFDLSFELLQRLDYVIASMHKPITSQKTARETTDLYIETMKYDFVKIIGHADNADYVMEIERFVEACKHYQKIIEINNSSFVVRKSGLENMRSILKSAKKYQVPVILNSDAHIYTDIGKVDLASKLIAEEKFPEDLVVNYNRDLFKAYFGV